MTPKDVIRQTIEFCDMLTRTYVSDLDEADLFVRPVAGANHIAWQLGHIITSEHDMLSALGCTAPTLPRGFMEAYTKETATSDDPAKFHRKADYLSLLEVFKTASLAAVDATPDHQLAADPPESMREYTKNRAEVLTLLGTHRLMHAGQFVVARRKLGRPPLF